MPPHLGGYPAASASTGHDPMDALSIGRPRILKNRARRGRSLTSTAAALKQGVTNQNCLCSLTVRASKSVGPPQAHQGRPNTLLPSRSDFRTPESCADSLPTPRIYMLGLAESRGYPPPMKWD